MCQSGIKSSKYVTTKLLLPLTTGHTKASVVVKCSLL